MWIVAAMMSCKFVLSAEEDSALPKMIRLGHVCGDGKERADTEKLNDLGTLGVWAKEGSKFTWLPGVSRALFPPSSMILMVPLASFYGLFFPVSLSFLAEFVLYPSSPYLHRYIFVSEQEGLPRM